MDVQWRKYRLYLKYPFVISKGQFTYRDALVVSLIKDRFTGLGEATEITYYDVSIDRMIGRLEELRKELSNIHLDEPSTLYRRLAPHLESEPFLLSALDCAAYDLYGKLHHRTIGQILNFNPDRELPPTSLTIGLAETSELKRKIEENPWPIYKIKLAGNRDLEIMEAVQSCTNASLRIDVNEGWTYKQCRDYLPKLETMGVELLEQPLSSKDDPLMPEIKDNTTLTLVADESCQKLSDLPSCQSGFHGINIKLMKCGGLTPALEMIKTARSMNLKVMVGCMTESSIGISAAAQLIPMADYVDLDGAMMLAKDIASGVKFQHGFVRYPDTHGLGCVLLRESNRP